MQKVTVSLEASDRKQNPRLPKKKELLEPKGKSPSFIIPHLDWKTCFFFGCM